MSARQKKQGRLWLNDGSCLRRQPDRRNHACTYDFVLGRTHDGRALRLMTVRDEYSRESLAIEAIRSLNSNNALKTPAWLFVEHGMPEHISSDNGLEMRAKWARTFLAQLPMDTLYIEPGRQWGNGRIESFNEKLRDDLLSGYIFYTVLEATIPGEQWRSTNNRVRPDISPG